MRNTLPDCLGNPVKIVPRNTETLPCEKYNGIPVMEEKGCLDIKKTTSSHIFKRQKRQKMPWTVVTSEMGRVPVAGAGQIFKIKLTIGIDWITDTVFSYWSGQQKPIQQALTDKVTKIPHRVSQLVSTMLLLH